MMWFLSTKIGRWLAMVGGFVAMLAGAVLMGRRDGRKNAQQKAKDQDHENAADIRDAVRTRLDERLRKYDGRGFRD